MYFRKNIPAENSNLDYFILWIWAEKIGYSDIAFTSLTQISKMLEMKETLKRKE